MKLVARAMVLAMALVACGGLAILKDPNPGPCPGGVPCGDVCCVGVCTQYATCEAPDAPPTEWGAGRRARALDAGGERR